MSRNEYSGEIKKKKQAKQKPNEDTFHYFVNGLKRHKGRQNGFKVNNNNSKASSKISTEPNYAYEQKMNQQYLNPWTT